jgi:hypothetical protein
MEKPKHSRSNDILVQNTKVRGAVCRQCRAKLYPVKLLKPHLLRHQLNKSWLEKELEKLQLAVGQIR